MELKPNEIFVFGSNIAGAHGGGAARLAYERFGAVWGQGAGLQGQSYAIPTMLGGVENIKPYVDEFIEFAVSHSELKFLVTKIGCGIAEFQEEEIAPLFAQSYYIVNIFLPEVFVEILRKTIHLPEKWNRRFLFDPEWAVMPSGKFVKKGDTLIGFEPSNDNILRNRNTTGLMENSISSVVPTRIALGHLVFPGKEISNIADGMFGDIEVLGKIELPRNLKRIGKKGGIGVFRDCVFGKLEIPADVTSLGDYVFAKCQIESLTIHHVTLKCEYSRQFKGSSINKLYLPESSLPLSCSELGLLFSIAANADVKEVYLEKNVRMSWDDFRQQI